MLELEFSNTGYIYMALIWAIAPALAVYLACKKKRNPFLWGAICAVMPFALFAIGGMLAPGEKQPKLFVQQLAENAEKEQKENDSPSK